MYFSQMLDFNYTNIIVIFLILINILFTTSTIFY